MPPAEETGRMRGTLQQKMPPGRKGREAEGLQIRSRRARKEMVRGVGMESNFTT